MMITYDDREFSQDRALESRHVWRWCWPGEREEWGINVGGSTTAPDNKGVKSEANKARLTFASVKTPQMTPVPQTWPGWLTG